MTPQWEAQLKSIHGSAHAKNIHLKPNALLRSLNRLDSLNTVSKLQPCADSHVQE